MKIGIWGFYFAENFGDDLMALQIARLIRGMGMEPLVFELSPLLGARYGIEVTSDLVRFCSEAGVILIGGGNLLAQAHTWPSGPFLRKVSELRMAAEHWNRPIHAVSIGGDGVDNPRYAHDVELLLRSRCFRSAIVRNERDVPALRERGVAASFVPDILWSAAGFFGIGRDPELQGGPIGLHFLSATPWIRAGVDRLRRRWRADDQRGLHFLNAFLHHSTGGDYVPGELEPHETALHAGDPLEIMRDIAALSCIASQRLHVGVVALSLGIPFLSVCAHPKVGAELSQIGWNWIINYDGIKPRRHFGAGWFSRRLAAELSFSSVQHHNNQVRNIPSASSVISLTRRYLYTCLSNEVSDLQTVQKKLDESPD